MRRRTIKSLSVTDGFDAVYEDEHGGFIREPIVGFAVVADIDGDQILPIVLGDTGIDFPDDTENYVCLARRGEPVKEAV